eukprot:m.107044 g.107044  ORF g.107044 m.107044 type:complete len:263 (+) comp10611_c0_seq1:1876-2664(+)
MAALPNDGLHYAESGTVTMVKPDVLDGNVTYLVYLPLRNAPDQLDIQVDTASNTLCGGPTCAADTAPPFASPPIVWYGGSTQQGGVTSRAGTAYDAIIARYLAREVVNLGLAQGAVMDMGMAAVVAKVDASVIVLDCVHDLNASDVTSRTMAFVKYLRSNGHATTPIVLAEANPRPGDWLANTIHGDWSDPKGAALRAAYNSMVASGDTHLTYVAAGDLFQFAPTPLSSPVAADDAPADLGQYEMANFYTGLLKTLLSSDHV